MKKLLLILAFTPVISLCNAQIFGEIFDNVVDGVVDNIADKAVKEISNKLVRNINKKFDESLESSYDSTEQVKYPKYDDYLASLNKAANVPESYQFDIWMNIETKDDRKKSKMKMYFSTQSALIGIQTLDKNEDNLIVMDMDNDVTVIYDTGEEHSAQAIPSFQKLTKAMVTYSEEQVEQNAMNFRKTGKTKKIAGYKCDEYKGETEDSEIKMYLAQHFPISFKDSYFKVWTQYLSEDKKKAYPFEDDNGMVLFMESKDNNKKKSSWKVKKVMEETFTITNADYKFSKN